MVWNTFVFQKHWHQLRYVSLIFVQAVKSFWIGKWDEQNEQTSNTLRILYKFAFVTKLKNLTGGAMISIPFIASFTSETVLTRCKQKHDMKMTDTRNECISGMNLPIVISFSAIVLEFDVQTKMFIQRIDCIELVYLHQSTRGKGAILIQTNWNDATVEIQRIYCTKSKL